MTSKMRKTSSTEASTSAVPAQPPPPDPLEDFAPLLGLYLRQLTRVAISIQLPPLRQPGQSISNWDLMERLKKVAAPILLDSLRVKNSTMENVLFEGELQSRAELKQIVRVLDKYAMKVSGFIEPLKVRALEAPSEFPARTDWDNFFRDPKNKMDETIPGERPDTIYIGKIPSNWLQDEEGKPSEKKLRQLLEKFGEVRAVDIPTCDSLRPRMSEAITGIRNKGFGLGADVYIEGYVQYMDYNGFSKAMEALRNKKWIRRMDDGRLLSAVVKVDFDRTRHLTDKVIRRRRFEREILQDQDVQKEEEVQKAKLAEEERLKKLAEEKEKRREGREQKRRLKHSAIRKKAEKEKLKKKIKLEKHRLVKAVKRVESIRLFVGIVERYEQKQDRRRRQGEEELRRELANTSHIELQGDEQEEERLRKSLLAQREVLMRQRIKDKMMQNGLLKIKKKDKERSRSRSRSRNHKKSKKHSRRHHRSSSSSSSDSDRKKSKKKHKKRRS